MKVKNFIVLILSHIIVSCAVIRPGEVGIKQRLENLMVVWLRKGLYFTIQLQAE